MNKKNLIFWSVVVIMLFVGIIQWGNYLINGEYIMETFVNGDLNSATNHTVNLPLTSTLTCKNMCGPNNRCSLTGEQCTSDIECRGCKKNSRDYQEYRKNNNVRGENDAGKLTTEENPTYSTLTTDIGTQAKLINKPETEAPKYFQGVNTWQDTFNYGMKLYDKRYSPTASYFTPSYPIRKTLSGEFYDNGPLAANDFL